MSFVATWIDLETVTLSLKSDREGQIPYQLLVESKKKKKKGTNELTYKIGEKRYRCRKQSYGCQGRKG